MAVISGIGTDILKMSEIPAASLTRGDPFYEKIYTSEEKRQADGFKDRDNWLRRRFAAKEAVFKALGENPDTARICEIEVLDDDFGAPHVTLYGSLLERAHERGTKEVLISLSSDGEYALAFAAAQTGISQVKGKDE